MHGEVKRGKGVREGTGPEGERRGKNEGKRVGGKFARKHTPKTQILVPLWFRYSLVAFQAACVVKKSHSQFCGSRFVHVIAPLSCP